MKRHVPLFALIFDLAIVAAVAFSAIWLFLGSNGPLPEGEIGYLKYFTVQSNLLLGSVALTAIPFDALLLAKKRSSSPKALRIAYLCLNVGTALTMLVALSFLAPTMGFELIFSNAYIFMHLLTPLFGLARILAFEPNTDRLSWKWSFLGIIHMGIYGIFYTINIAIHNGYGDLQYDWYGFGRGGLAVGLVVYVGLLIGVFFATFGLLALQSLQLRKRG